MRTANKIKSLLIVDDEKELAELISEIASTDFEKIYVCNEGNTALDVLKNNEISIVLSDISMPEMSGEVFLKKMRAMGFSTPIVFLTGNASKDMAISALKLGASDFLEKPFQTEKLVQTLRLTVEVEEHKRKIIELDDGSLESKELLALEKKSLAIKQAARSLKK